MKIQSVLFLFILSSLPILAQKWTNYNTSNGLVNNWVYTIAIDKQGNKWFGTDAGVAEFDSTWNYFSIANGLTSNYISAIAIDSVGNKWFGTYGGGVTIYDGANWTTYTTANGLISNNIFVITIDRNGNKWIGTDAGITFIKGNQWMNYSTKDGLVDNYVQAIAIDPQGNAWCGTDSGVSVFDGTFWNTYTISDGLADNNVQAIVIDTAGNKWFGTYEGGITQYNDSSWTTYTTTNGLASNYVYAMAIDIQGNIWIGTDGGGVSMFDGNHWTTYNTKNGLVNNVVHAIAIDTKRNKWFGTVGGGVAKLQELYLTVSANTLHLSAAATSSDTIFISSNTTWNATSDQFWLTLTRDTGSYNGYITLNTLSNLTDTARIDTIFIIGSGVSTNLISVFQNAINTGIINISERQVRIYPVPVIDLLMVDIPEDYANRASLEIYSVQGIEVYTNILIDQHNEIDLSSFNTGIYFIKIRLPDQEQFFRKIIHLRN